MCVHLFCQGVKGGLLRLGHAPSLTFYTAQSLQYLCATVITVFFLSVFFYLCVCLLPFLYSGNLKSLHTSVTSNYKTCAGLTSHCSGLCYSSFGRTRSAHTVRFTETWAGKLHQLSQRGLALKLHTLFISP